MNIVQMLIPRIFQISSLMTDMPDVLVTAVNLFQRLGDRNIMRFCISDTVFTGLEIPLSPRRYDLERRIQRVNTGFKTNLIVALSRAAVSDGHSAFLMSDSDQFLRDQRTSEEVPSR